MAEFKLPELGEDIEEAEVLKVLVKKGDSVAQDQPVLELETDKATFEVPSALAGTVSELHVSAGDTVKVGDTVLTVEEAADAPEEQEAGEQEAEGGGKPKKEEKDEGEKEQEQGAEKKEKAPAQQAAGEREGKPKKERAVGGEAKGAEREERADRDEGEAAERAEATEDREQTREGEDRPRREPGRPPEKAAGESAPAAAGPATRRLARELGVDLGRLEGSGPGGRVTPEDVKAAVGGGTGGRRAREDRDERRPLTGLEKAAIRHLSASWSEIPHVTHHDSADVTELERARQRYERSRERSEAKLTMTALVIKASVAALKAFPRVNASLDLEAEELVLKRRYHVGVAVDTEHGLLVPVLRDADARTTREIAAGIAELAERARERKLSRDDMRGATFTVTNLGGIGGTAFTPIVSRPEVAILGVSRTREEPALRAGQLVRRLVLPLSLSYDHRVINGADAARFVRHVAGLLEEPLQMLVES